MDLGAWLRRRFGRGRPPVAMVSYYDETGRVVQIPASELAPGAVRVQIEGMEGPVWMMADRIGPGEVKHPGFGEGIRDFLRTIRAAFAEHRPLSLDEWEEGFRRDTNPEREIALWLHAADVYTACAEGEASAERREDVYHCIILCFVSTSDTVWHVLKPSVLSREEAGRVVDRFYGKAA